MTLNRALPNCWNWNDEDGNIHTVAEGTTIEMGSHRYPTCKSLCGHPVLIGVRRDHLDAPICERCYQQLAELIRAQLGLQ